MARGYTRRSEESQYRNGLRRLLLSESLERFVERVVLRRRRRAEVDVGLIDFDVGCETALVDAFVLGCEVTRGRQQQSAAIRQLHELLTRGASERAFSDELGAIVAGQCRGKHFGGSGRALIDEQF